MTQALDWLVGPQRPEEIAPDSLRPPPKRDRSIRFSDDGPRVFDFKLGCWVKVPVAEPEVSRPLEFNRPAGDGSGVFWEVWDNRTGRVLWTVEAFDFSGALDEKRRLCAGCGGRSGWAHIRPKGFNG